MIAGIETIELRPYITSIRRLGKDEPCRERRAILAIRLASGDHGGRVDVRRLLLREVVVAPKRERS